MLESNVVIYKAIICIFFFFIAMPHGKSGVHNGNDNSPRRIEIFSVNQDTVTWTGAVDSIWSNPGNWFGGIRPDQNDHVIIQNPGKIQVTINDTIRSLETGSGSTIEIDSMVSFYIIGSMDNGISGSSTLNNYGSLYVLDFSSIGVLQNNINNHGSLIIESDVGFRGMYMVLATSSGLFVNYGTCSIQGCSEGIRVEGRPITNHGDWTISNVTTGIRTNSGSDGIDFENGVNGAISITHFTSSGFNCFNTRISNKGSISLVADAGIGMLVDATGNNSTIGYFINDAGAYVEFDSVDLALDNDVTFTNKGRAHFGPACNIAWNEPGLEINDTSGIISGSTQLNRFTNIGTLSPGSSPGIFDLDFDAEILSFDSLSTLEIEIFDNSGPGTGHDQLKVVSPFLGLNGTLNVTIDSNYVQSPGDEFVLITSPWNVLDSFHTVVLPPLDPCFEWEYEQLATSVVLRLKNVFGDTIIVSKAEDSVRRSLRNAIQCANDRPGSDTIVFDLNSSGIGTINLLTDLDTITEDLTIINTIDDSVCVDASNLSTFLVVNPGVHVKLEGFKIITPLSAPGKIFSNAGQLRIENLIIQEADGGTEGITIENTGDLQILENTNIENDE